MSYYGSDDWDYERDRGRGRPPAHRNRTDGRRSQQFLDPNAMGGGGGLFRTRSQGAQPAPNVYIYNDMIQDANQSQRSTSRSPPSPAPYPPSPRYRGRRQDDELAQGIMDLALTNQQLRSRSRGRSDAGQRDGRSDFYERQWRDLDRQRSLENERERIKQEYELKALRDEEKRKRDEADAKEERKRIIAEHEQRLRDESEDRKDEEERIRLKIEREEKEAKEKKKKAYDAFLVEQKARAEKEKAEKKEAEEKFEQEMRKRLERFGYKQAQIDIMVAEELDKKDPNRTTTTTTMTRWGGSSNPVYPKIHVKYLSVDTLRYYELPWEYDAVSKSNSAGSVNFLTRCSTIEIT